MNRNEGFSLIEAAMALAVISVLGFASISFFSESLDFLDKAASANIRNKETATLVYYTMTTVERIRFPFWTDLKSEIEHPRGGNDLLIPYLDGKSERTLALTYRNGILSIKTPELKKQFAGGESCSIGLLKTAGGGIAGVSLTLKYAGRESIRIMAPFGAIGNTVFHGTSP